MFFIDTPLDICMARRLLRDYQANSSDFSKLREELSLYLEGNRNAYLTMDSNVKDYSDFVLDGQLSIEELINIIISKIPPVSGN